MLAKQTKPKYLLNARTADQRKNVQLFNSSVGAGATPNPFARENNHQVALGSWLGWPSEAKISKANTHSTIASCSGPQASETTFCLARIHNREEDVWFGRPL